MTEPKWSAHVVAILKRHPRADKLSLQEVSRLSDHLLRCLVLAVEAIDETVWDWQLSRDRKPTAAELESILVTDEERVVYSELWLEAARLWGRR